MKLLKKCIAIFSVCAIMMEFVPVMKSEAEFYHDTPSVVGGDVAIEIPQITVTKEQLENMNYKVPLFVKMTRNPSLNYMEFGIRTNCPYEIISSATDASAYAVSPYIDNILDDNGNPMYTTMAGRLSIKMDTSSNGSLTWATWGSSYEYTGTGSILLVVLTVPDDFSDGRMQDGYIYYDVAYAEIGNPTPDLYMNDSNYQDYSDNVEYTDGWVRIKMEEETTTSTTTTTTTTTTTSTTTTTTTTTTPETTTTTTTTTPEITTTTVTTETKPPLAVMENEITLEAGQQYQIEANQDNLTYSSNNTGIAVVSSSGKITALKEGKAVISVINQDYDVSQIQVTVVSAEKIIYELGDTNHDAGINAKDAAEVLVHSANIGAGNEGTLSPEALIAADVNADGDVNSKDAAEILVYAAVKGAGGTPYFSSQEKPNISEETTIAAETSATAQTTTTTKETTTTTTARKAPEISSCSINVEQGQYEGYTYHLNINGTYDYYYVTCYEYGIGETTPFITFSNKKSTSSSLYLTAASSLDHVTVSVTPYYSDGTSGDTVTRTAYQPITAVSMPENCSYMGTGVPLSDDGFVNLRSSMSLSDNIITQIPNSTRIKMYYISNAADWVFVEYGQYAGYAKRSYVKLVDAQGVWADGKNAYDAELQEFGYDQILKSKSSILYGGYTLFDMNHDEIPELIIDISENDTEGGREIAFYTYSNGKPVLMKDGISGWHVSFMKENTRNQLVTVVSQMGYGKITWYQCSGISVLIEKEQEFSYSDMDNYKVMLAKYGDFSELYLSSSYD